MVLAVNPLTCYKSEVGFKVVGWGAWAAYVPQGMSIAHPQAGGFS